MTVYDVLVNAALFTVIWTPCVAGLIALLAWDWQP